MTRTILSLPEVAEMTGVPIDTLRYWRATGKGGLASFRLGRRVVFDLDTVTAWIEEQRRTTTVSG
jgi:excisionase family DNA binding protein